MTTVDVVYRYGKNPTEAAALALARVREVYGVRRLEFREAEKTVVVEYDSTRLSEQVIHQLLRRSGLDVLDKVILWTPPVPVEAAPAS
jgi:hypothetical protein